MRLFYDTAIYGFLLVDGLLVWLTVYYWIMKRGWRWQFAVLLGAFVFGWFVIFYGSFIEPQRLVVTEKTISLAENSSSNIRAVLISDFHLGPYKQKAWVEKTVEKINTLSPQLIVIAGDFILGEITFPPLARHSLRSELAPLPLAALAREPISFGNPELVLFDYLAPLKNLKAEYGVYAVLGNHDYIEGEFYELLNYPFEGNERVQMVTKALADAGIRLLRNESVEIALGGGSGSGKKFLLGGTDEYWTGRADAAKTFNGKNPSLPKILAVHNPDEIWDAQKAGVDFVLAAHTHGGQIRLPWIGSVPPIPDKLGRKYDRGLFQFGETQMFITSGLGETGPRARLLVPPEIAVLNIKF